MYISSTMVLANKKNSNDAPTVPVHKDYDYALTEL